ncbi:hypothetical protein DSO57_1011225 [Entomophthora muscae]|uniref:Uncharacterized protein n=1 Tax=Entomophthora muscae TaxID=34485 RepID=A0ACC2S8S5_9FUNG|nr:hypothetical protein DSO57_1011225 [Entomophthora muscae]
MLLISVILCSLVSGLPPSIGEGVKPSGADVTAIAPEMAGGNATIPGSAIEMNREMNLKVKNKTPAVDESLLNSNNVPESNPIDMSTKLIDENIHHLTDFTTGLFGKKPSGQHSDFPAIDFGKAIPSGLSLMEVLASLDAEQKKLAHAALNSNELLTSPVESTASNLALGEPNFPAIPQKAAIKAPAASNLLSTRKAGLNLNVSPNEKDGLVNQNLFGDEPAHKLTSLRKPQSMAIDEEQSSPLKPSKDTVKILVDGNESRIPRGTKPAPLSGTRKPSLEGSASRDLSSIDSSKLSGSKEVPSAENLSDKVLSPSPSHPRFKHD